MSTTHTWNYQNNSAEKPSIKSLREERVVIHDKAAKILAAAQKEKRELNADEQAQANLIFSELANHDLQLSEAERNERVQMEKAIVMAKEQRRAMQEPQSTSHISASNWCDRSGKPVAVLNRGDSWSDLYKDHRPEEFSVGNIVRAVASGNPAFARREYAYRNAMSGNDNGLGGFLVPDMISSRVLDKARATAAVTRAGAIVVPMESESLSLARVIEDPSFARHTENETLSETDIGFSAVLFNAATMGCFVRISRELAADAPNVASIVENCLAKALAAELDRQALQGNAGAEETGLTIKAGIDETGSVGAIAWEDIHAAAVGVRTNNYEPTGYIVNPEIAGDLDLITSGDGSTASKNWLGAPPSLDEVVRYTSTNCPTGYAFVGDFTQAAFGIRQGALIEVTTTGGDSFTKHSVLVKCTWRGCFRVLQEDAFYRLAGITT